MRTCILNVAVDNGGSRRYAAGQQRLKETLSKNNYAGDLLFWDTWPSAFPDHNKIPYAFKLAAWQEAIQKGYDIGLWIDASDYVIKPIDPILHYIRENGHILWNNGANIGTWSSDRSLRSFGITRDEAFQIAEVTGNIVGFDLRKPKNLQLIQEWTKYALDGVTFPGPWHNKNGEASSDPRVRGHRHDQTALSFLAHKYKLNCIEMPQFFDYKETNRNWDNTMILCSGL